MTDEPENHTLALLRRIDGKVDGVAADVSEVKHRLETLEHTVSGVAAFVAMVHGKQLEQDERIEALEKSGE